MTSGQARSEYEVKAAFLYNFAKFAEWPSDAFASETGVLKICVLGQDPFGGYFDGLIANKTVNNRKLEFEHVHDIQQARTCQILYVASAEKQQRQILQSLIGARVLTVGDSGGFAQSGGVINFLLQDRRVRFEINVDAAGRSGVKLSAKLLSLASIVRDGPPAGKD